MSTLALPQLIGKFVETGHFTPDEVNALLTALTTTISQGLKNGKSVSVPGIGTFRAIVMSGEVSVDFAPDSALAAEINAPFALFEPVELPDGVTEEDIEPEENFSINTENATIPPETTDNQGDAPQTSNTRPITGPEPEPESEPKPEPEAAETKVAETEIPAKPLPTPPPLPQSINRQHTPEIAATEQNDKPDNEAVPYVQDTISNPTPETSPVEKIIEREKVVEIHPASSHHTLNIILTAVISLLAGLLIGYFVASHLNIGHVENVNIEADGVTVYPTESQAQKKEVAEASTASAGLNSTAVEDNATNATGVEPQKKAVKATVITDTVKVNRYLTTMALQHYGKKKFWVYIYQENKNILSDPDHIAPNTVVVIPPADKYGIRPGDKESETAAERLAAQIYQDR